MSEVIDRDTVERARAAARAAGELGRELEQARRLTPPAIEALIASGVPKIFVPRELGGAEANVPTAVAAIEALAYADGSLGWCGMIAATSGLMAAFLPEARAASIFTPAGAVTAGVFAPMARAELDGDGYRVSGRWTFGSGCQHAAWIMGGAMVGDTVKHFVFQRSQLRIHDTWDTSGLRGTGSHDLEAEAAWVPRDLVFSLLEDAPRHGGALYRQPFFGALAAGVAGVALGIARRAVDALIALAVVKTPAGARRTLAHRELVQLAVARADAMIEASRAHLLASLEAALHAVAREGTAPIAVRARVRGAASHAVAECARAVDLVYEAGGGSAIYAENPLGRCFRDVHVATQHVMVSATSATMVGRVLLGLELDGRGAQL